MKWFLRLSIVFAHLVIGAILFGNFADRDSGSAQEERQADAVERNTTDQSTDNAHSRSESRDTPQGSTPSEIEKLKHELLSNQAASRLPDTIRRKTADCTAGTVIDLSDRSILWSKNLKTSVPVASLTKMMTALLLMEHVHQRSELSLSTSVEVTEAAAGIGGSQIYMDPRESFTVQELIEAMMIFSANDAAYLAAQVIGKGDVEKAVSLMNQRAEELGLSSISFVNPHGLPLGSKASERNQANVLDMSLLAVELLKHEAVTEAASTWITYLREDTEKPFQLINRNRLVRDIESVNGMKTGYTERAGFCITATSNYKGKTLIITLTGCDTSEGRNSLVEDLLAWGYHGTPSLAKASDQGSYVVQSGDTLYEIAKEHGTSVDQLKQANDLDTTVIREGQELDIP